MLAGLAARRAPVDEVAWLLRQRLLPGLRLDRRVDPLPLLRRAGVRDAALGAEGDANGYEVRLSAYAGRRRALGDGREAERAERLRDAVRRLLDVAVRLPVRGRLPDMLEAWRAGLDVVGFWTALEREPLEDDPKARRATAREAAAVEVWRELVRDSRAGWKAARARGPEVDRAGFARWLLDAAGHLPVSTGGGVPGGVDVLLLESLGQRRLAFLGIAGLDAASFPRRPGPSLLGEEERQAIHGVLGRVAVPSQVVAEAIDRWRLGRALATAEQVVVGRRRSAGGAPADVVQRLLAVTGAVERDLSRAGGARPRGGAGALLGSPAPGARGLGRARPAKRAPGPGRRRRARSARRCAVARRGAGARRRRGRAPPGRRRAPSPRGAQRPDRPGGGGPRRGRGPARRLPREPAVLHQPERARQLPVPGAVAEGAAARAAGGGGRGAGCPGPGPVPPRGAGAAGEAAARPRAHPRRPGDAPGGAGLLGGGGGGGRARPQTRRRVIPGCGRSRRPARGGRWNDFYKRAGCTRFRVSARWPPRSPSARTSSSPRRCPRERPVYFRGKLDRVDRGEGGTGVVDYKSSKRRDRARAELLVTDFQLPLYLLALRARGERPPFQAGWLSLKTLELLPLDAELTGPLDGFLATDAAARAAVTGPNLATAVHGVLAEPREGLFPVRPRDCGFCPLGSVCRISERRAPTGRRGMSAARPNACVFAGAGTGKTHGLVTECLRLLGGADRDEPLPPAKLCLLTFTEKAAAEMRGRLAARVAALAAGEASEPELAAAFAAAGRPVPPAAEWRRVQGKLSLATIATFHGFCAGLLRRAPAGSGTPQDFVLLDEEEALDLLEELAERLVLERLEAEDRAVEALCADLDLRGLRRSGAGRAAGGPGPASARPRPRPRGSRRDHCRRRHPCVRGYGGPGALAGGRRARPGAGRARRVRAGPGGHRRHPGGLGPGHVARARGPARRPPRRTAGPRREERARHRGARRAGGAVRRRFSARRRRDAARPTTRGDLASAAGRAGGAATCRVRRVGRARLLRAPLQGARPARLRPRAARPRAGPDRCAAPRRVPGHQPAPAGAHLSAGRGAGRSAPRGRVWRAAVAAARARVPLRGGRPQAVHLRLPRRRRGGVRGARPGRRGGGRRAPLPAHEPARPARARRGAERAAGSGAWPDPGGTVGGAVPPRRGRSPALAPAARAGQVRGAARRPGLRGPGRGAAAGGGGPPRPPARTPAVARLGAPRPGGRCAPAGARRRRGHPPPVLRGRGPLHRCARQAPRATPGPARAGHLRLARGPRRGRAARAAHRPPQPGASGRVSARAGRGPLGRDAGPPCAAPREARHAGARRRIASGSLEPERSTGGDASSRWPGGCARGWTGGGWWSCSRRRGMRSGRGRCSPRRPTARSSSETSTSSASWRRGGTGVGGRTRRRSHGGSSSWPTGTRASVSRRWRTRGPARRCSCSRCTPRRGSSGQWCASPTWARAVLPPRAGSWSIHATGSPFARRCRGAPMRTRRRARRRWRTCSPAGSWPRAAACSTWR